MKLFGYEIRKAAAPKPEKPATGTQIRPGLPQGPMTSYFQDYVLRKVSGEFYEALREGIPIIDSAIRRLISLNGTIKIIGARPDLVAALEDFNRSVPVNDTQTGIHSFLENASNETLEQGFSISEFVVTPDLKDIAGLRVADSKDIRYRRNADGRAEPWYRYPGAAPARIFSNPQSVVQTILTASYGQTSFVGGTWETKLTPTNLLYFSINNENGDPYGVSVMRSMEFVSKLLMTMQNSLLNVWERFGDPSYKVIYKGSKAGGTDLTDRQNTIKTDFAATVDAKRSGKSADFVYALDKDSDITVEIIGADGQVLEMEIPARHVLEQIVSKTNLPAWMLGIYWSTTERMATLEVEMALQDAKIRQLAMIPEFIRLYSTYLSLRGFKWKTITTDVNAPGDWGFIFETPNVRDVLSMANARFLNAQADMMERGGQAASATSVTVGQATFELPRVKVLDVLPPNGRKLLPDCSCGAVHASHSAPPAFHEAAKEVNRPTPWPKLDKVEKDYEKELKYDWNDLKEKIWSILRLPDISESKAGPVKAVFSFGDAERDMIMRSLRTFLGYYDIDGPDSSVKWYYGQAYSLGLIQAANLIGKDRPILDLIKNQEIFSELAANGFRLVKDNATRRIRNDVIMAMEDGMTQGVNPKDVARTLDQLFGDQNSDWERLARTEMSGAAQRAKLDEWKERGVDVSNAVTVPVHPRCRCDNSIEQVGDEWQTKFIPAPDACDWCLSLQAGDKGLEIKFAALRQKGPVEWYRSWDAIFKNTDISCQNMSGKSDTRRTL